MRKVRLIATLRKAGVAHADDPSNRDPRFTRVRIRNGMPMLEREGLDAGRLALLARRARRADLALEAAVDEAVAEIAPLPWPTGGPIAFPAGRFARLPAEVSLRLLAAPSPAPGTKDRSNWASSKRCTPAWRLLQTPRGFDAPWRAPSSPAPAGAW